MQENDAVDSKNNLSFEDRVEKVKNIVDMLSSNSLSLKDGMKLYEEGMCELREAQLMLEEAQIVFNEIKNNMANTKNSNNEDIS